MSQYTGKPCAKCGGRKGPAYADLKYCGKCKRGSVKRERRDTAHGSRILATYQLTPEQYAELYRLQDGKCAICRWATGRTKRLSVDHDHACCPTTPTCGKCTRGLLCGFCNRLLGFARDAIEFFERAIDYLRNPPFRRLHGGTDDNAGS